MGKSVMFLGLGVTGNELKFDDYDDIWSMNDWYRLYPMKISRVYDVHSRQQWNRQENEEGRYADIENNYRHLPELIRCADTWGLPHERLIDKFDLMMNFPITFFGSTVGYMFADAILEGDVDLIHMRGIDCLEGEGYTCQIGSIIENIQAARKAGIEVYSCNEQEWINKLSTGFVGAISPLYGVMLEVNHNIKLPKEVLDGPGLFARD